MKKDLKSWGELHILPTGNAAVYPLINPNQGHYLA